MTMSAGDRGLLGQQLAHPHPGAVQLLAVQPAVGPGQVHELEQAQLGVDRARPARAATRRGPVGVDDQQLARLELAHEVGADDVEGRRLRRQHPAPVELAQAQRPEAVGVPHADQPVVVEQDQGKRPLQRRAATASGRRPGRRSGGRRGAGQQLGDQVAVAGHHARQHAASAASASVLVRLPLWPRANRRLCWAGAVR